MEAAPLIGIAQAPVPEGGRAVWLEGADGAKLRVALFPAPDPRGSVVLSPGRTEPIEKYFEVVDELRARGWSVLAHDWRGQGLSARALPDRLRGHAAGFRPYLSDYGRMLDRLQGELPKPWIGLAHSMGGGLALLAVVRGEGRLSGLIATAPMIGLASVRVLPRAARMIAWSACRLGLAGSLLQTYDPFADSFEGNGLTHDRRRYERYMAQLKACPDLALGGPTWGWLDFALSAGAILDRRSSAAATRLPLAMVCAGQDKLVLSASAKRFAEGAPRGRYVEIAQAFHEILMETDAMRAVFWREFDTLAGEVRPPSA